MKLPKNTCTTGMGQTAQDAPFSLLNATLTLIPKFVAHSPAQAQITTK